MDNNMTYISKLNKISYNKRVLDARGSLSISEKTTIGNYVQDRNDLPLLLDREGTGTQTYINGGVLMSVTPGQYSITQSFHRHPYFAGKSQVCEITFDEYHNELGIIKRVGYYSSSTIEPYDTNLDGFYFESDGTNYKFSIANADTSGITTINQSDWNIDTLDGSTSIQNPSGVLQDFSKFNVLIIDFLYLGGTAVRFGFKNGEDFNWAHVHNHANYSGGTFVSSPHQPVRWEIRSTTGTGSCKEICAGVHTEGTLDIVAIPSSTPIVINHVNANTPGINYIVSGIRLKNTESSRKTNILNTGISAQLSSGNDYAYATLWLNPTIVGTPTWSAFTNENDIEYIIPDTVGNPSTLTVSGGKILFSEFVSSIQNTTNTDVLTLVRRLGHKINGTPDEFILTITPTSAGANSDAYGIIQFNVY
jgi:hypothetical protein